MELVSVELHMSTRASKIDPVGVVAFVRDLLLVEELRHLGLAVELKRESVGRVVALDVVV